MTIPEELDELSARFNALAPRLGHLDAGGQVTSVAHSLAALAERARGSQSAIEASLPTPIDAPQWWELVDDKGNVHGARRLMTITQAQRSTTILSRATPVPVGPLTWIPCHDGKEQ